MKPLSPVRLFIRWHELVGGDWSLRIKGIKKDEFGGWWITYHGGKLDDLLGYGDEAASRMLCEMMRGQHETCEI